MQEGKGSFTIAKERKEVKDKGEKERYTQPKTEFRRIARREIGNPS